jgi:hypothetical protein
MILAVDPGPVQSAFVLWDGAKIQDKGILENADMLHVGLGFECPAVVEMIQSQGQRVGATTFETVFWIGRFFEAWRKPGDADSVQRIYRLDVKLHICQSARAQDADIRRVLLDRFGEKGTKARPGSTYGLAKDMWQAFALAVTWWDTRRTG